MDLIIFESQVYFMVCIPFLHFKHYPAPPIFLEHLFGEIKGLIEASKSLSKDQQFNVSIVIFCSFLSGGCVSVDGWVGLLLRCKSRIG